MKFSKIMLYQEGTSALSGSCVVQSIAGWLYIWLYYI